MRLARLLCVSLCVVGLTPLARGPQLAAQSDPPARQITIDNFTFAPQQISVAPGTTITWTNNDDVPHTVVGTHQEFRSKALDTGDKFSFTFAKPGGYEYFCSVHPMMTGKIIVQ
jgi:plastocyanin